MAFLEAQRCPFRRQALHHQRQHEVQHGIAQCSLHGGKEPSDVNSVTLPHRPDSQRHPRKQLLDMETLLAEGSR